MTHHRRATEFFAAIRQRTDDWIARATLPARDPAPRVAWDPRTRPAGIEQRWKLLGVKSSVREALADPATVAAAAAYEANIESFIGTARIPIGLAGPLRVDGMFARGDYYLPLATTEAALVASFNRGAQLVTAAGGCTAALVDEAVSRTPGFAFASVREAVAFVAWAADSVSEFRRAAEATTQHGRLVDVRFTVEGNHVYVHFDFATEDAAGQNIVTIASEAICGFIREHAPVRLVAQMHDGGLSGEKKQNHGALQTVRGRRATAEATIPSTLVERHLRASPAAIARCWRMAVLGCVMSGVVGAQGHYANGLAALFIACGQDVACVAEAAMGVTRVETTEAGDLHIAVTLPNLIVGTVGGGTALPTQRACLEILGLAGAGHARAFAEVCACVCLAGELSVLGALAAGELAEAHRTLARLRGAARP